MLISIDCRKESIAGNRLSIDIDCIDGIATILEQATSGFAAVSINTASHVMQIHVSDVRHAYCFDLLYNFQKDSTTNSQRGLVQLSILRTKTWSVNSEEPPPLGHKVRELYNSGMYSIR